jgi:hypothetical protein
MHKTSELESLAWQIAAGHADAAEAFRRLVQPALACLLRHSLQAGAGPTTLGQAVATFLRDSGSTGNPETCAAPEAIEPLAQILSDRLIARLSAQGAAGATVPRAPTIGMD